jgi:hypothetical protein
MERGEEDTRPFRMRMSPFAAWRRRLLADVGLEKVLSIIRVRQYELRSLVADRRASFGLDGEPPPELRHRLDQAEELAGDHATKDPKAIDRASAHELLDKLEGILPLVADHDRLGLMLQTELDRRDTTLSKRQQVRGDELLEEYRNPVRREELRPQVQEFLTAVARDRSDRLREQRAVDELRQNYLTWLVVVLVLLLAGTSVLGVLAAHSGLWADVLLAVAAGALGATLSGVILLRAPQASLAVLKNLGLVMLVQPLVGAGAGLVLFAIWRSGLLTITGLHRDDWAAVAIVAFAGGFSEPFFLKSIARITGKVGEPTERAQASARSDQTDVDAAG